MQAGLSARQWGEAERRPHIIRQQHAAAQEAAGIAIGNLAVCNDCRPPPLHPSPAAPDRAALSSQPHLQEVGELGVAVHNEAVHLILRQKKRAGRCVQGQRDRQGVQRRGPTALPGAVAGLLRSLPVTNSGGVELSAAA